MKTTEDIPLVNTESRYKHLEFIQANITRMAQNSFQIKEWAITIVAALLALFASSFDAKYGGNAVYLFVGIAPTVVFWFLDSYYLQQERKFRSIYDDVVKLSDESTRIKIREFEIPLSKYKGGKYRIVCVAFSRTELPFYLLVILGLVIAGLIMR
jgi:hypothetical protein